MSGRKQELNLQFQEILDGTLLVLAFWLAHVLRFYATEWFSLEKSIAQFSEFRWVLWLLMPLGPLILEAQGFYKHILGKTVGKSLWQLLRAASVLAVLLAVCWFFLRLDVPSRAVLILFAVLAALMLLTRERLTILYLKKKAASGRFRESVLLAGMPLDIAQLEQTLTPEQTMEMEIVGRVDIEIQPISELVESLHKYAVSRVIFAGGHSHLNRLQEAIAACEVDGVEAWLVADFIKTSIARPDFDMIGTRPMLVFCTTPEISWALLIKGCIDRVGALILLVPCSLLMLLAAIAIKLTSPGPIVFRQTRAGKHGKPFTMYKFRTMVTDAEMRQA